MPKFLDRLPFRRRKAAPASTAAEQALEVLRKAPDAVRTLVRHGPDALEAIARRAPDVAETVSRKAPDAMEASLRAVGRSKSAQVAPAVLLVTGAGVAFWWWTQWARGRAESDAAAGTEKDG